MISFIEKTILKRTCKYRVGDIYITLSSINPNTKWPWTTWEPFAVGRTIFGIDPNDSDFSTVEQEGGSAAAWYHNHTESSHTHTVSQNFRHSSGSKASGHSRAAGGTAAAVNAANYGTISSAGSSNNNQPAEIGNMQPYIVTYIWKRIS